MFSGKWIFIAAAALSGILFVYELHIYSFLFIVYIAVRIYFEKQFHLAIVCLTVFIFCALYSFNEEKSNVTNYSSGPIQIEITFKEVPRIDGNQAKAIVTSQDENFLFTYLIRSEAEKQKIEEEFRAGTTCYVNGELQVPTINRNEDAFNYSQFLKRKKIHWILEGRNIQFIPHTSSQSLFSGILNYRAQALKTIEKNFPETIIPYAKALIFGDRSSFPDEILTAYQQTGTVHLLAISGLHIGILVGLLHYLLLRIGMTKETVYWAMLFMLPIYALLSGGNPPVGRAVIMALLVLSSNKWRWSITTLDALAISFIIFVIMNPYIIYEVGFQLSFIVTLGLIMFLPHYQETSTQISKMTDISITSMLVSLPLLTYHFYEFSISSILTNLIFVPFYSVIVLPVIFGLWLLQFVDLSIFLLIAQGFAKLLSLSEQLMVMISSAEFSVIVTGKPRPITLCLFIAGIFIYFFLYELKGSRIFAGLPLFTILIVYLTIIQYSPTGEVIFIDVGQGDSTLIKLPYNRGVYLIDTGGKMQFYEEEWQKRENSFQIGKQIVAPLLKSKGIARIDKLILTHSDMDHIGAGKELLSELVIKEIYISPNSWEKPMMKDLIDTAQSQGISVMETKAGKTWENKSGKFSIIYPFDDQYEGNNDSIVLYALFAGKSWLFMGDVEKAGEKEIIHQYKGLNADILKVGHHGSHTSSEPDFIDHIQPVYAVISAGKDNRYGHPHSEVINTLNQRQVKIYRTDEDGAIHFKFSKKGGTFRKVLQ